MKLYYTGAPIKNIPQGNPNQSLGGFKSSTLVPNARKNALFSDISMEQYNEGDRELRGLILKNETGAVVSNITAYFNPDYNGITTFDLLNIVSVAYFSITGTFGEIVKLIIPSNTVDSFHLDLYNRVVDGGVGGGDFYTLDLFDGTTTVNGVILDVISSSIVGTNAEIIFEAPNYTSLGLVFATTVIDTTVSQNYVFTSLNKVEDRGNYEIAAVTAVNNKIESVNDGSSLPFVGTFVKANGYANRVTLVSSIPIDGEIGLWITRTISIKAKTDCKDLEAEQASQSKVETMNLIIDFV